jgi:hypothetical protein
MKFLRTNLTDLLDDIAAGVLGCPPGRTVEELKRDDIELRIDMERYYAEYIRVVQGEDGLIWSALFKWLASCSRDECTKRFLDEAKRFPSPADFWCSFHDCWNLFNDNSNQRLAMVLGQYRPYWRQEYLERMEIYGYDFLPEVITVYHSQKTNHRVGLIWSGSLKRAQFDASASGSVIIEARIAKRDIAGFEDNWMDGSIILFSATAAKRRRHIEIK